MSNCTLNKIIRNHGVKSLDLKHKNLVINTSNREGGDGQWEVSL